MNFPDLDLILRHCSTSVVLTSKEEQKTPIPRYPKRDYTRALTQPENFFWTGTTMRFPSPHQGEGITQNFFSLQEKSRGGGETPSHSTLKEGFRTELWPRILGGTYSIEGSREVWWRLIFLLQPCREAGTCNDMAWKNLKMFEVQKVEKIRSDALSLPRTGLNILQCIIIHL